MRRYGKKKKALFDHTIAWESEFDVLVTPILKSFVILNKHAVKRSLLVSHDK